MKADQFVAALLKNTKQRDKDFGKIVNAIKKLRLEKRILEEIDPVLSEKLRPELVRKILNN